MCHGFVEYADKKNIFSSGKVLGESESFFSLQALRLRNRTNLMTARQSLNLILIVTVVNIFWFHSMTIVQG